MTKRYTQVACSKANWDGGQNPFDLPEPPKFILDALREYDSHLLLLPGITQAVYRLCVRAPEAKRLKGLANDGETNRAVRLGCCPLTSIVKNPDWWKVLQWVKDHDTWAAGGADKFLKVIEGNEAAAAKRQQADQDDEAMQRAISGWHGWKFRTGQATFVQPRVVEASTVAGQPSGGTGPGTGDLHHGSLPAEPPTRVPEAPCRDAQAEDSTPRQNAEVVSGAASGQS